MESKGDTMRRTERDLNRVERELATGDRHCSRLAWYGGYCWQHAPGATDADRNAKPDGYCQAMRKGGGS